jgi:hypothetical protein
MLTKSGKAKGRRLQNWVREALIKWFDLAEEDVRCAIMGERGADVDIITLAAQEKAPFSIECKNKEKFKSIYDIMDQAASHKPELFALGIIKMNGKRPLAIMDANDFFIIAKQVDSNAED